MFVRGAFLAIIPVTLTALRTQVPNLLRRGYLSSMASTGDFETKKYINQQTMLRIKDPEKSLSFYEGVLGMSLLKQYDFPQWKFSLYFMGYCPPEDIPSCGPERTRHLLKQRGTLELTHNHDSEEAFADGNEDPFRGFGHIGLTVPDVYAACERFERLQVPFRKKPDEGGMKGLAFIKDPDGYSVEILASTPNGGRRSGESGGGAERDEGLVAQTQYKMTQTMLRVKDPKASLKFYTEVLGMDLLWSHDFPEWKFSLYFVGYCAEPRGGKVPPPDQCSAERRAWAMEQPAAIELTHNWGTEDDPSFKHANGNDEDTRGFGHFGIVVPDVYSACERFKRLGVAFRKEPDAGGMKGLAFIQDPDGYSIEILNFQSLENLEEFGN
mmetsp:Transcript_88622/g.177189  ORF Transcript_88622/g.177189 Transcript_88622/m.177189 type:complete len:382 (-) Transcript_88622:170-1315(-)